MSGEQELPKVGEWWWYGFPCDTFMRSCRIVAIRGDDVGVLDKSGSPNCIPTKWLLGPMAESDIPQKEQPPKPWWRFWK